MLDKKVQGIFVVGNLVFLKREEAKLYDGKERPAYNKLQVTVVTSDGFSVIDIKDTEFLVSDKMLNTSVSLSVSVNAFNGNTYYKLLAIS